MQNYAAALIFVLCTASAFAQPLAVPTYELKLGTTTVVTPFLVAGESAPLDGYLIALSDVAQIKIQLDHCESDCQRWLDARNDSCAQDLLLCSTDCDKRVIDLISTKEQLLLDNVVLTETLSDERLWNKIYLVGGTALSFVTGIVIGSYLL